MPFSSKWSIKYRKKVKKLEEYSGLEGTAVFDYCAKIGVNGMKTES